MASSLRDSTRYVYKDIGRADSSHAGFDDIRALAMAIAEADSTGIERWIGTSLSTALIADVPILQTMVVSGLGELAALLQAYGVH